MMMMTLLKWVTDFHKTLNFHVDNFLDVGKSMIIDQYAGNEVCGLNS